MNIHYVAPHFYPDIGGVEDHVQRLGAYMVEKGHEVTVHTSRESVAQTILPQKGEHLGISIKRYSPRLSLGYYATMFRPIIGSGEILHTHGYAFLPNDFSVRHYHGRMGTVMTTHHGVRMIPPNLRGRLLRKLYDTYGVRTLKKADKVFTSSRADRDWLLRKRIPAKKVEIVPDGIADESFSRGDTSVVSRHGLSNYIMFLGRLHNEKNVDHLLKAVTKLHRQDIQVAIVGPDGGALSALRQTSRALGLEKSVKFLGLVSDEEKRGLLAGCSLLALPSLYEAQGLVILEAWAQGRPIVACSVGGVPDMVKNGVNGLLYNWGNVDQLATAISRLLDDRTLSTKLGSAGKETARLKYHWTSVAARIEGIYSSVLADRPWRHKPK